MGRILASGLAFRQHADKVAPVRYAPDKGPGIDDIKSLLSLGEGILTSPLGGAAIQGVKAIGEAISPTPSARERAAASLLGLDIPSADVALERMEGENVVAHHIARAIQAGESPEDIIASVPEDQRERVVEHIMAAQRQQEDPEVRAAKMARVQEGVAKALAEGVPESRIRKALMARGAPSEHINDILALAHQDVPGKTPETVPEALEAVRAARSHEEEAAAIRRVTELSQPMSFMDLFTGAYKVRAGIEARKLLQKEFAASDPEKLKLQRDRLTQQGKRLELQTQTESRKADKQVKELQKLDQDIKIKTAEANKAEEKVKLELDKLRKQKDKLGFEVTKAEWEASKGVLQQRRAILNQQALLFTERAAMLLAEKKDKPVEQQRKAADSVLKDAVSALRSQLLQTRSAMISAQKVIAEEDLPELVRDITDPAKVAWVGADQDRLNQLRLAQSSAKAAAVGMLKKLKPEVEGMRKHMSILLKRRSLLGVNVTEALKDLDVVIGDAMNLVPEL